MKKLILLTFFLASAKLVSAQKNFEGEIDYKMIGLDDLKKDTITGDRLKVFFGEKEVRIERVDQRGILYREQILLIDSLMEIIVDYSKKSYWIAWKANEVAALPDVLPWGMNKVETIKSAQKVAGYDTYITQLTNTDKTLNYGHIDLNTVKNLTYKLPAGINKNLFLEGLLIFRDHIMAGIKIVSGVPPHSQQDYVVTKIDPKRINFTGFKIPPGFKFKTLGNGKL